MNKKEIREYFSQIPTIETERLILRQILPKDCQDVYEYSKDEEVTKYLLWNKHPNLDYSEKYLFYLQKLYSEGKYSNWAIVLKETGKMIGTVGFTSFTLYDNSAEIGYVLNKNYWGNGYAKEAVGKILEISFKTLTLNRIDAKYMIKNIKSKYVAESLGLHTTAIKPKAVSKNNKDYSIEICSILSSEYFNLYG